MRETRFKDTEIGMIPENWEVKKIGEIASITTGSQNTQDKNDKGIYPFYVRSQKVEHIDNYVFDTEGVVTAGDGVGTGKVFHYVNGKFGLHQRCYLVYDFEDYMSALFFYWVFSERFYDRVHSMTAKSSVDSVRMDMISEMQIPIPPTKVEQEAIASALSDVDGLLRELDGLIAKKRAIKQGMMQELLTVEAVPGKEGAFRPKRRLEGFEGDWVEKRLGEIIDVFDGTHQTPKYVSSGYQFYSVENVTNNEFRKTKYISETEFVLLTKKVRIEKGDVLMTRIGSIGVCKYVDWEVLAAFYVSLALLKKKNDDIDMRYLAFYSNTELFKKSVELHSLIFAIPQKINLGEITNIDILIPSSKAEQTAIAEVLSDMDGEIAALEAKRAKYEQVKNGMMQELLTGRIRLV